MKKSRIFVSLGALALVVAGAFASKANNKKFAASITTGYIYETGTGYVQVFNAASTDALFVTGTGTSGIANFGGYRLYYATSGGTKENAHLAF